MALGIGCTERLPTEMGLVAEVIVHALTPATVRTLVVAVSGPGIDPEIVVNIPVGADSVARDTLVVPAGSGRRFVITAVDTAGVATHRGDTTITLVPGVNSPLAIVLRPLASSVGITVTFGDVTGTPALVPLAPYAVAAVPVRSRKIPETQ